ncbi:sensor domain-containing diguanylate cyclase [Cytobacillus solani]|uniref:Diguanylate cyclase n=1 Tax=Cytobacillus solani TaxID=1637975 RepID=A0A0Q3QSY7_9BACI|nr:sensor domain-containing diguanylate cyclase [Cytobacillus solani]KQL20830.1 diguanylate cyclase [Cytobacillus solani]
MEQLEQKLIMKLKSHFLDIMDIENGLLHFDEILKSMLHLIKDLTGATDATFFSVNEWNKQLLMEASTIIDKKPSVIPPSLSDLNCQRTVIRQVLPGFEEYNLILLFKMNQGCVALKGDNQTFSQFSDEILEKISGECARFLHTARYFVKTILEERRYKQLYRVTEKFHSSMNMDDVLGEIINTLQEVYPTFTYYLLLSHDNNKLEDLPIKDLEYDSENIAAMQAYVTGVPQFEDSLQEKRSVLYAPLKGKQGVYGVLQVIAPNTIVFPTNEVEFITLLANTAGTALENAQLYQQSKRLIKDLQLINETSHRLNSNLRLTETMAFITEQIIQSFNAEEVGFILFSKDYKELKVLQGSTGFFQHIDAIPYIEFIKGKVEVDEEALFIGDFNLEDESKPAYYKSIMAVPMTQSGVLKGIALVMHHSPYHFSFETFKLLQSLVHHSTLAVTNSILREELEKMVVTDHLTKLYSRSYLDDKIHQSMNEDHEGTFMMIDIDNFKLINDTFGHQVGDDVIIQVANLINANIRGSDIGARWGGEELAIYLPGVSLTAGLVIAERLVKRVSESTEPQVTISCGVSHWNRGRHDSYPTLFKRADKALYIAKQSGKNKVIVQEHEDRSK